MKSIRLLSIFLLLSVVASGIIGQVRAEDLEGAALEEHLIKHSPWNCRWGAGNYQGSVVYVFERNDESFAGKITEATGTSNDWGAQGPLKDLKVENGKVSFTSQSGTAHTFRLDKKRNIKGDGTTAVGHNTWTYCKLRKPAK